MMGLSFQHLLILLVIVLLLFGRGKISELMGDFAKGVKSFKKGLAEDDEVATATASPKTLDQKRVDVVAEPLEEKRNAT